MTVATVEITIAGLVREIDDEYPGSTDQEIVGYLTSRLADTEDPLSVAAPALLAYTAQVRRTRTREHEKRLVASWKAAGKNPLSNRQAEAASDFLYWARLLVEDTITVGGEDRRAGALSPSDWDRRGDELEATIAPVVESVERARYFARGLRALKQPNLDAVLS